MLACRIHAKEDLRIEAVDTPEVGPGQVLLRLGAGGICGSDLHYYFDGRNGSFIVREPLIPGHEASATVAAIGAGRHAGQGRRQRGGEPVARLRPVRLLPRGPRAALPQDALSRQREPLSARAGHVQRVLRDGRAAVLSRGGRRDAGRARVRRAAAVALHAVKRGTDLLGKSVLITGAGTIGCLTVIAARLAGAKSVTVSDILDRPLAQAREVGADRTLRADREADALAAPQFDVCYEVSGSFAALKSCVAAAKHGGVIVQVGTLPHEPLPFVVNELMAKELDLKGAFRWGIEFDWAVDYLSSRKVDVRPLLSGQFPLQDAVKAFAARQGQVAEHEGSGGRV